MRFRVNATGGRMAGGDGIQITIRTLPSEPPPLADLGIEPAIVANLRPPQGMILVPGPTGSGKSTLLSAAIRSLVEGEDSSVERHVGKEWVSTDRWWCTRYNHKKT